MVHKKSTYKLMYKNYGKDVRRSVWLENTSIRERRREEEMSHHSIDESDSDCACDDSEEEEESNSAIKQPKMFLHTRPKSILMNSDEQIHQHPSVSTKPSAPPPHIPKLQFSPEQSPRASQRQDTPNGINVNMRRDGRVDQLGAMTDSNLDLNVTRGSEDSQATRAEVRGRQEVSREQMGVMRPGSRTKEYDLIPAVSEGTSAPLRRAASAKPKIIKSYKYPLTSQLSRTTRKNYNQREKVNYVPCGSGASVRRIGDRTSYNVHLHRDQVQSTALQASSLRNKEIEDLIRKQRTMTLADWREGGQESQYINHSSLWDDGRTLTLTSKPRIKERLRSAPSRVETVSNCCRHCGGRK